MALDMQTALNAYGFVGLLAQSDPELKAKFEQAANEEWPEARFNREIQSTNWWRTHADSARNLFTLQQTDPATFQQNLTNAHQKISLIAGQMGRQVDNAAVGLQALLNNWDDEQIRSYVGATGKVWSGGGGEMMGDAAQIDAHIREVAANYGAPVTQNWIKATIAQIQSGRDTMDGLESLLRARAKATYPQFAAQIDAGMTVRDIADPYIATMANTLEVSETTLGLNDSWVKKALAQKQPDGSIGSMPLWQFERQLKDDPRYDKTKQARDGAYSMLSQIGKDWGFSA